MSEQAHISVSGRIATLTLDRPEARNALSEDLLCSLNTRLDELGAADPTVLIVTGAGKGFCAGMDLKLVLNDPEAPRRLLTSLARFLLRLRQLPMVVLASVNGAAIGGGCGLAVACDLAITHADAKMGFPEVDLGVCPAVVAPWVVRKVGAGKARRILLSGGLMTGQQAADLGLVDFAVASREELDPTIREVAARLATGGPQAIRATKHLLNQLDGSLDESIALESAELSARVLATDEARAMLAARLRA
ncbi:MAG: enoyl-CoA hydratase/isomerase family protein [Phycisphaerales bacterium]